MTLSNWVLIPVQLSKRQRIDNGWGLSGGDTCAFYDMPSRLMWFDQDWTLAKCHRVILTAFMYTFRGDFVDEPLPSYDDIFGLSAPKQPLREGFDDINETALPFIVNIVKE